ncbi:hypothetical protein ZIOFF_025303 [Zingiber officinale]|uniref:LRR receptor-like serine/threonine-protein kinase n=1 Tax=Zingiber officinale TaxID=94328 RepID=A0A8J5GUT8_ZINOF|nr:hypothetical protein ZIOFF_025303 [Zingiber officinale]
MACSHKSNICECYLYSSGWVKLSTVSEITPLIYNLAMLTKVILCLRNLSYNNLTGKIPEILGTLSSLWVSYLIDNNLSGPVPDSLLQKSQNESLILILEGNPNLTCTNGTPCKLTVDIGKTKKIPILVIMIIICVVLVAVFLFVSFFVWRRKEKSKDNVYRGFLNNSTPVAVKTCFQSSRQGTKHFFAEVPIQSYLL